MATKKRKTTKTKSGSGTTGKKIMAEAKRIRRDSPNMKWQTAVSRSAKKLSREGKI